LKILVTGINGFAGKILREELESRGHAVYGLDITGDSDSVFAADIRDYSAVKGVMGEVSPDITVHLAAVSRVDFENVNEIYEINVDGTLNLLKACSSDRRNIPFLLVSSSQVYGNPELQKGHLIDENFKISPVNHYGASKAAAENIALAFHNENGLPLTIVRPFNHTGVGQSVNFVVPKIANAFKIKEKELHLGNIDTARDFLDVRDVVNAYVKLIENFQDGEIFNVASGKGFVIGDVISILKELTGHDIEIVQDEKFMRENEISAPIGDPSKIKQLLNWHPDYRIKDTLMWMLEKHSGG